MYASLKVRLYEKIMEKYKYSYSYGVRIAINKLSE